MTFQKAIAESSIAEGHVGKAKIGKKAFALVRKDGKFYCIDGICTHEGGPLGEGTLVDGWLECPWHQGHFDYKSGDADPETDWVTSVKSYRTKVDGGFVYIDF